MKKNKLVFVLCIVLVAAISLGVLVSCTTNPANPDGIKNYLVLDENVQYQSMTGFGASAAWWAQTVPQGAQSAADLATSLYTDEGIGLTIYRYNIGGGSWDYNAYEDHAAGDFVVYPEMRNTQSAFIAENYDKSRSAADNFADDANYDFSKDANALEFMRLCAEQEGSTVERIILFANSPHYLLTTSGKTNGDYAYQSNLPKENYQAYCEYLMKYLEKTGEKIVYSRGLPQFFITDVTDDDVVCEMGDDEYKKLLLFDNFICWDDGEYIGRVSAETISKLPKSN